MRANERRQIFKTLNRERERRINRFLGVSYWYCSAVVIITISSNDVVSSLSFGRFVQLLFLFWAGKGLVEVLERLLGLVFVVAWKMSSLESVPARWLGRMEYGAPLVIANRIYHSHHQMRNELLQWHQPSQMGWQMVVVEWQPRSWLVVWPRVGQ
ncbi:hypothetical protein V6N13_074422 [Hibiscus sabdariffa]